MRRRLKWHDGVIGTCRRCQESKPLTEFAKKGDGWASICRDCDRERARENYHKDPAKKIRRVRERYAENRDEERRKARERYDPEAKRQRTERENPRRKRARVALQTAVHHGKLEKPSSCERCGAGTEPHRLHGHHHDYDKPLDVEWICSVCHGKAHRFPVEGREKNAH